MHPKIQEPILLDLKNVGSNTHGFVLYAMVFTTGVYLFIYWQEIRAIFQPQGGYAHIPQKAKSSRNAQMETSSQPNLINYLHKSICHM